MRDSGKLLVMKTQSQLTLFFDSECPLCANEIAHLRRLDVEHHINFEDIHAVDFEARYPWLSRQRAMKLLHGQTFDGKRLYGLDVTVLAWTLVGKRHWVSWLRWPGIKSIANFAYKLFARHRQSIAHLFTGNKICRCGDAEK